MTRGHLLGIATATALFAASSVQAADENGSVQGVVKDASGQPVAGAFVKLKNDARRLTFRLRERDVDIALEPSRAHVDRQRARDVLEEARKVEPVHVEVQRGIVRILERLRFGGQLDRVQHRAIVTRVTIRAVSSGNVGCTGPGKAEDLKEIIVIQLDSEPSRSSALSDEHGKPWGPPEQFFEFQEPASFNRPCDNSETSLMRAALFAEQPLRYQVQHS